LFGINKFEIGAIAPTGATKAGSIVIASGKSVKVKIGPRNPYCSEIFPVT
jgi:hypothetical protein